MKKISFPVDERRSKTPLLKLPIKDRLSECRPESAESSLYWWPDERFDNLFAGHLQIQNEFWIASWLY